MKDFLQSKLYRVAGYVELFVAFILVVFIGALSVKFMIGIFDQSIYNVADDIELMNGILAKALNLAVGVEFVKMLSKHTPSTVIEVLLFATARQMVAEHTGSMETLLGVITIAILFATRKFLFSSFDETEKIILRASLPIRLANLISHAALPDNDKETLGEVVKKRLEEKHIPIATGAIVYYDHDGIALRIAKMHEDRISRVEVIRSV